MDIVQLAARIKQIYKINESPNIHPNIQPIYTYLTDPVFTNEPENNSPTTLLSTDIESCIERDATETRVYLCIYLQNEHSIMISPRNKMNTPYISFYMEHADRHVSFPSFQYDWREQPYPDLENGIDDAEMFKAECIRNIIRILDLEQVPAYKRSHRRVDFGYRGVVPHEGAVFAFFDFTHIRRFFRKSKSQSLPAPSNKPTSVWAIIDEILHRKKVFSVNVDSRIHSMFSETPVLWHIQHHGEPITYPRAMYAVVSSSEHVATGENTLEYKTDRYDPKCVRKSCVRDTPLLAYSDSDIFAERYLFTTSPIPETHLGSIGSHDATPTYKRFACFVYQPMILLSTQFAKHRELKDKYPENFVENIRAKLTMSETHDDNDDAESYENGGIDVEESEPYRNIPCICFTQKIAHHRPMEFWGFIHSDLFDEIGHI